MPALASTPPRRDDTLDVVATIGESPLDPLDEGAQVGIVGPRVHLRDEQNLHDPESLTRRPRAREVPQASRAHGRSLGLRPVRGCALSRLTSNALPDRPNHGYAPALLALLRRRLSATVLLPCSGDPFPAVLATIFRVVVLHVSSSPSRSRRRTETDGEDGITRVYRKKGSLKQGLSLAVVFSRGTRLRSCSILTRCGPTVEWRFHYEMPPFVRSACGISP